MISKILEAWLSLQFVDCKIFLSYAYFGGSDF